MVKSDITIPETLRRDLIQEAGLLEQVPDNLKDWHPGSNKMVLDLLHPSLFPLVYGRSRVLPFGNVPLKECAKFTGLGEVLTGWGRGNLEKRTWDTITQGLLEPWGNYQWLPVQVELATEGRPHITSYINNLHPEKHEALYSLLEQFVDRTIPLWNECLSWSWFSDRVRIPTTDVVFYSDEDWIVPSWPLRAKHPDNQLEGDEELDRSAKINECWADEHDLLGEWEDWKSANLRLKPIEPRTYQSFYQMLQKSNAPARHINLKADFNSTGLQIIFKLASIHLTPDKPKYDGGRWHVEGALNEHICATALYYYDSDNISPSSLAFRQSMHTEDIDGLTGEQDQYDSFCAYYGVQNMGSGIQELGRVLTPQGRLLVFPNVLQHYVEPFHLADPTRPGHRKILAMFLVDPHITVLSTANVPPQRRDWWADEVRKISPFDGLPYELFLRIVEFVDGFPMSWQDACEVREGLMEERGRIADRIDEIMDEVQYFLKSPRRDCSLS